MRRLCPLSCGALAALTALPLGAAVVSGKVSFVTKRGQNPVANETLVWLEPAGRAMRKPPQTFQMMTRGKALARRSVLLGLPAALAACSSSRSPAAVPSSASTWSAR